MRVFIHSKHRFTTHICLHSRHLPQAHGNPAKSEVTGNSPKHGQNQAVSAKLSDKKEDYSLIFALHGKLRGEIAG